MRKIERSHAGDIACLNRIDIHAKLLSVLVLEHTGASRSRGAHDQDAFATRLVGLLLEGQGKCHGDVAELFIRGLAAKMTLEYLRGASCHRIGQRKPRLDIGQHGVIHMHVIFKAIAQRADMPSKVHAKFKIAAKVKPKLIVDRTYHLGSNLPHLVRDNGRALLGHARAPAEQMDCDKGNLFSGHAHAQGILDVCGNLESRSVFARSLQFLNVRFCSWDIAALLDAAKSNVKMHDEIAGCQRAHRDGRGRQSIVHTCGDGPQALGELCIVGVGQHGPHQRGQAQAPLRLPARNADSVAWALFER